jgi:predicted transcriptional regulator
MIDQLFGSKTRVKLLQLFYSNPNRSFYVREITRKIDEQINSVRRELSNLLSIGIIVSDTTNNRLYYEVNQKFEYFSPLTEIFGNGEKAMAAQTAASAVAAGQPDTQATAEQGGIKSIGNIEIAVYTGQFTRDDSPGVDVFLVGDINQARLSKFMTDLETKEGKELRYTQMSLNDFQYRKQIKDRFVANILQAKKQVLIDKHNLLQNTPAA